MARYPMAASLTAMIEVEMGCGPRRGDDAAALVSVLRGAPGKAASRKWRKRKESEK